VKVDCPNPATNLPDESKDAAWFGVPVVLPTFTVEELKVVAISPCADVFPVIFKFPLTVKPVTVLIVWDKSGWPLFCLIVNVLSEYVKPVTKISWGKFWYVVADIVFTVTPFWKLVNPVTVPPLKGKYLPVTLSGKFWYVVADIVFVVNPFVNVVDPVTVPPLNGRK
jgi:hypothetical protein